MPGTRRLQVVTVLVAVLDRVFPARWVASRAVLRVRNAFLLVLLLNLGRLVLVAPIAGVREIVGGVANLAFHLDGAAVIQGEGMFQQAGWKPSLSSVTRGASDTELVAMYVRYPVTGDAVG